MEACVICKEGTMGEDVSILTEKGAASINLASRQRGHADIADEGDTVHKKCRRKFNHPKYIQAEKAADQHQNETKKILRSENIFNFQEQCIFCGLPAKFIKRKRGADVHPVLTMEFQEKVLESCTNRNDEWGHTVKGRISYVNDLHAADAVYHQTCSVNFRTGKNIPSVYSPIPSKERRLAGRPCATQQEDAFSKTCAFLANNDNEQVTVMDLTKKMAEFCDEPYTRNYMKKKLQTHFGSDIVITEINGLPDVVTFCYSAKSILYDFYKRPQSSSDKESIIKAAARFILSDIKSIQASTTLYPSLSEIESLSSQISYVPDSLQLLLSNIFLQNSKDLKIASIGQAIMQTSRPRALLAPIQISLGIQLHQQFASRFLLDTLNSLGFSASYSEIKRFQSNAAVEQGQSQINLDTNSSLQFVADNVDPNSCTVDGHGTFHGMGIIGSFTPGSKFNRVIPRNDVSKESILEAGTINVLFYKRPQTKEQHFIKLREMDVAEDFWFADLLCNVLWPLRTPRISWSGFMQMFRSGQYPGKSSTVFFPMIDLPPSDMTCIFSTLHFVCKEASKYEKTPVITFDQPLYWKARQIISDEADDSILKSVVLRLGGFHLEMSFLGAIGHIMSGSGLQEVLETVFAPNAVGHMISGKAVSRAIRGHNLVSSGLNAILLARIFELDLPSTSITAELNLSSSESRTDNGEPSEGVPEVAIQIESEDDLSGRTIDPLLDKACSLYDSLLSGETKLEELAGDEIFDRILSKLEEEKKSLETKRTAKLWLQYLDMVHLLMKFIEAERTGNWKLHQKTISMMLPYLAAAGHNLYLKSAYLYLSDMQQLESKHPEIYAFFEAGHHVIRRSDRFWAGLSSDIVIEQVLMRSMKTSGGLTRGRGMTELQRIQWLLSSPACAEINYAMQTLTGVDYHTSDQHKESGKARQSRDDRDAFIVLKHVMERNPFDGNEELRSIETGIVADQKVNVDRSKEIGLEIVNSLPDQSISGYSFKRSKQAVTLNSKGAVKVDDDHMHVDPQLLFQRLITVSRMVYPDISVLFAYELSTHPSSLYDSNGLPRVAQKSTLANAIWSMGDCDGSTSTRNSSREFEYVIDGGSLIYKLPWEQKASFGRIVDCYSSYVLKKFGRATIVFDGYPDGPSTKDITHLRRSKGIVGRKVVLSPLSTFNSKKEVFLSNLENKKQFVSLLGTSLQQKGCNVVYASEDADVSIVTTALDRSVLGPVAVIGEDTDLLVLLIHLFDSNCHNDVVFYSDRQGKDHKVWDIHKTSMLLQDNICQILPLVHAITGCDTTSRVFSIGKSQALKKFITTHYLQECASVFSCDESNTTKECIASAGEKIICNLLSAMENESLDQLRYRKFVTKTLSCNNSIQVHELPPTSAATYFHSCHS